MFILKTDPITEQPSTVLDDEKNSWIPLDVNNGHYQMVLQDTVDNGGASWENGEIPSIIQEHIDSILFESRLSAYKIASKRLAKYVLSDGRHEYIERVSTGRIVWDETLKTMVDEVVDITHPAIKAEPETVEAPRYDEETKKTVIEIIRNPLIVKDEEERAAAQAIVDATPQEVKDAAEAE